MAKLILIRGAPGSGKSTLSVEVAKKLCRRTIVIPKDKIVFGFNFVNISQDKYKSQAVIKSATKYYLDNNINVIIDGVFGGKNPLKKIKELKNLAKESKSKFYLVNLDVKFETSVLRDDKRSKRISKKEVKKWYDHFYIRSITEGFVLDNNKISKTKAVNEILKYINSN